MSWLPQGRRPPAASQRAPVATGCSGLAVDTPPSMETSTLAPESMVTMAQSRVVEEESDEILPAGSSVSVNVCHVRWSPLGAAYSTPPPLPGGPYAGPRGSRRRSVRAPSLIQASATTSNLSGLSLEIKLCQTLLVH